MTERAKKYLMTASLFYENICPEQSQFLMHRYHNGKEPDTVIHPIGKAAICPFCYQWFQPGNHRVRLRPKRQPSARVQGVLRREGRGKRLSLTQVKLLRRFRNASSTLMATCHTCNKTSRHNGSSRGMIANFSKAHRTPGSAGKCKSPQTANKASMMAPKSASKDKTPCNTPRSISFNTPASGSSSSSSSKPPSVKKSAFQRLRKFLTLEDSQSNKKTGLKDFLSSL